MAKKIVSFSLFLFISLFFVLPKAGFGQEEFAVRHSREQIEAEVNRVMQAMQPAMLNMMKESQEFQISFLSRKETAIKLATFSRNYYVALVKTGFTKEEALQIVVQCGIPDWGPR